MKPPPEIGSLVIFHNGSDVNPSEGVIVEEADAYWKIKWMLCDLCLMHTWIIKSAVIQVIQPDDGDESIPF